MTTWVEVSEVTEDWELPGDVQNGYVEAGYVANGYIVDSRIWEVVDEVSTSWS